MKNGDAFGEGKAREEARCQRQRSMERCRQCLQSPDWRFGHGAPSIGRRDRERSHVAGLSILMPWLRLACMLV
jgi:hypothetical protein